MIKAMIGNEKKMELEQSILIVSE